MIYILALLCVSSYNDIHSQNHVFTSKKECITQSKGFLEDRILKESCNKVHKAMCYEIQGKVIK